MFKSQRTKLKPMTLLVSLAFLLSSCSYPLTVKNMTLYKPSMVSSLTESIRVGIVSETGSPEEERLVLAVVNALKRDGFQVTSPFYVSEENKANVDYIVNVATSGEYDGSGWNFLINWPGFLIFTPAWHGYIYKALFNFDVDITDVASNKTLPRITIPVDLDVRHAAMNRTWTEVSYLEWSIIAFIGGIVFTRYDQSVTPQLIDKIELKVGDYVASKVSAALATT